MSIGTCRAPCSGLQEGPRLGPDDAVGNEILSALEVANRCFRLRTEDAGAGDVECLLEPNDVGTGVAAPQGRPVLHIDSGDEHRRRGYSAEDGGDAGAELVHVEAGIVFPLRSPLLVADAEVDAAADVFEDCGHAAVVGIQLDFGPDIVGRAAVLCLDPDEVGVAGRDSLPDASCAVIGHAGGDDVVRSVAAKPELRERSGEGRSAGTGGAAVDEGVEGRHVARSPHAGVMADHPEGLTGVGAAAVFPSRHERDFQTGIAQDCWQPGQGERHTTPPVAAGSCASPVGSAAAPVTASQPSMSSSETPPAGAGGGEAAEPLVVVPWPMTTVVLAADGF